MDGSVTYLIYVMRELRNTPIFIRQFVWRFSLAIKLVFKWSKFWNNKSFERLQPLPAEQTNSLPESDSLLASGFVLLPNERHAFAIFFAVSVHTIHCVPKTNRSDQYKQKTKVHPSHCCNRSIRWGWGIRENVQSKPVGGVTPTDRFWREIQIIFNFSGFWSLTSSYLTFASSQQIDLKKQKEI